MNYVICVFKLRSNTLKFYKLLNKNKIKASVVATPKSVGSSCGVSVKIDYKNLLPAKKVFARSGIKGLSGFYLITKNGSYQTAKRL